jgi:hypothetical protein
MRRLFSEKINLTIDHQLSLLLYLSNGEEKNIMKMIYFAKETKRSLKI